MRITNVESRVIVKEVVLTEEEAAVVKTIFGSLSRCKLKDLISSDGLYTGKIIDEIDRKVYEMYHELNDNGVYSVQNKRGI